MKSIKSVALLAAAATALSGTTALADYTLNILHINDLHSRIEPINRFDSTCNADDEAEGKCFGGVARLKTKIDERRERLTSTGQNVITLDAGDQFQGSLFYTTYKGTTAAGFMNGIGFDAMAVGNHEFDDGPEALDSFINLVEFPVISGNTIASEESVLAGKIPSHAVLEVGGERIGIVSVLATDTDETSSPGPTIEIIDEIEHLTAKVAELEADGINKIVLLSHVGLARDKEIAAAVDGIDVIVGGHSHTLLSNIDEDAADTYPVRVANPSGVDVPIVQAYAYSKYLGELRVTFDDEGNVTRAAGEPHLLDASVTPDAGVAERVAALAAPIEELKARPVGEAAAAIEGSREVCRAMECAMGNLVADAIVDRVKDQGVTIAIQNGGGLRASIDEGQITMGEVLTVLPFQNTLATFEISGAGIVEALENGVSRIDDGAGRFPQVSGLKYTFDKDAEPGSRISDVMVADGNGGFGPIDEGATYKVGTNNYMRGGGDGYGVFASDAQNAYDFGPGLEMVVADYIAANSPYEPYTDGRITASTAELAAPELTEEATEEEAAADTGAPVVVPETGLSASTLSTDGPTITVEPSESEAPASEEEASATEESATEETEVVVAVPETGLAASTLSTDGPTIATEAEADGNAPTYTIAAGDNFWELAREFYGDATMFTKLIEANPDADPTDLKVGASIVVPE
ncbi:MAG: 5'-nucleotidase C-terminal domain-containing protein [Pseudomonadota bacterium]